MIKGVNMDKSFYTHPHYPKVETPETDDEGFSDLVVIGTTRGEVDVAFYCDKTKLWYSATDPTGFSNVVFWSPFVVPDSFDIDEDLYYGGLYE